MRLRLLHVLDPLVTNDLRRREPRLHFRDDSYVENLAADVALLSPDAALDVEGEIIDGSEPVAAVADFLDRHPESMAFLGTRRRTESLLEPGGLAAGVVERSPSPVLVVSRAPR
jgi:nucleotide-binding universal stress UspA family protein